MAWWWPVAIAGAFEVERGDDGRPVTWPAFPVRAGWVGDEDLGARIHDPAPGVGALPGLAGLVGWARRRRRPPEA